ncbi:50S ribosomal protein L29 [Candidatus Kaiserbacteria bacterium]|nr:50S ribosomal protein L29 [Candidatus Kaiserbacteria bacterium]
MKMSEITKKDSESLIVFANELRESLRSGRFGAAGSRARDVKHSKGVRRDIARIETALSARRLARTPIETPRSVTR